MIYTLLYYIIFSSTVLIYGIGLNTVTIICDSFTKLQINFVKVVSSIIGTVCLSWVLIKQFLVPFNLTELYPLVALLIFMAISIFLETMIRITARKTTADFNFSFLIILLTLNESIDILDVLMVSFSSLISFFVLLPVLYVIKSKFYIIDQNDNRKVNSKSILLISLAIIIIVVYAANVSWLNPGVIK